MADDKNPFGGGNPNSLYTPMSEYEQEVLERLIDAGELEVHIVDWGIIHQPKITFGDLRLCIIIPMKLDRPPLPQPNFWFDLELKTRSGILLYKERLPTMDGGKPIQLCAGMELVWAWDIAIQKMDPKLVKALKPGALGLTTHEGNRKLNTAQKKLLHTLREGEAKARQNTQSRLAEAAAKLKKGKK